MITRQKNSLFFFQFPHLSDFSEIRHGIFTRLGGYSRFPYESLNVCIGNGDKKNHVLKNRYVISRCMDDSELFFTNQVHGTNVLRITGEKALDAYEISLDSGIGDALITDAVNKSLVIQMADCQSVMMFDSVKKAVANIHSGWRGNIQNIIGLTVQAMIDVFKTNPKDIVAGIGPSLGQCCAEFINYKTEIPKLFWSYKNSSNCFDFWSISKDQLTETGIPSENIFSSNICTRCRTDIFFSYRKEGLTGRFASVIGLKNEFR